MIYTSGSGSRCVWEVWGDVLSAQTFVRMSRHKQRMLSYFSEKRSIVLQHVVTAPFWDRMTRVRFYRQWLSCLVCYPGSKVSHPVMKLPGSVIILNISSFGVVIPPPITFPSNYYRARVVPMVVSYFMGWGDVFRSHKYTRSIGHLLPVRCMRYSRYCTIPSTSNCYRKYALHPDPLYRRSRSTLPSDTDSRARTNHPLKIWGGRR